MKERVQVKHDIAENWAKAVNFVPLPGEIVIYDGIIEENTYIELPRIKVGDGIHAINELPFLDTGKQDFHFENGILRLK